MPSPNYINTKIVFEGVQLDPAETPAKVRKVVYEGMQAIKAVQSIQELQSLVELLEELEVQEDIAIKWDNGTAKVDNIKVIKKYLECLKELKKNALYISYRKGSGRKPSSINEFKKKLEKTKARKA